MIAWELKQERNLEAGVKHKLKRNFVYWVVHHGLLSIIFYIVQGCHFGKQISSSAVNCSSGKCAPLPTDPW